MIRREKRLNQGIEFHEIIRSLVKEMNPSQAYRRILEYLTEKLEADVCQIVDCDENVKAASPNLPSARFSRTILRRALKSGQALLLPNAVDDDEISQNDSLHDSNFYSVIVLPMHDRQDKVIGALYLARRGAGWEPYEEDHLVEAQKMVDTLSMVLQQQQELERVAHENITSDMEEIKQCMEEGGFYFSRMPEMHRILQTVKRYANTDAPIYLTGETGVGKDVIAEIIHHLSDRKNKPFESVMCGNITESLAESELFGHEKGAFTGAGEQKIGVFEKADGGTIFLNEIGELTHDVQKTLLQVVQPDMRTKKSAFKRVGGTDDILIDVRVIIASNKSLAELVDQKKFRSDLFYRLKELEINIPPLRKRPDDITPMAMWFLKFFKERYKKPGVDFSPDAIEAMKTYDWPGNVREMQRKIERAVIECADGNKTLTRDHLFKGDEMGLTISLFDVSIRGDSLKSLVEHIKEKIILLELKKNNYNITHTAKALKITRQYLHTFIKKHNIATGS